MKQNVTVRQHKDCPANNVPIHSDSQTSIRDKTYRINFLRINKSISICPYIAFIHSNRALGTRMYVHVRAHITIHLFSLLRTALYVLYIVQDHFATPPSIYLQGNLRLVRAFECRVRADVACRLLQDTKRLRLYFVHAEKIGEKR